jgi:hypothetical protein
MPTINIYLPEELFELVKPNKSKIIQQALKELRQRQLKADSSPSLDDGPAPKNNSSPN